MTNFYQTPVIPITTEDETLSNSSGITLGPVDGSVKLDFTVPVVAQGVRIYKGSTGGSETLLIDIPLSDTLRKKDRVSLPMSFIDDGTYGLIGNAYPTTTTLSIPEQSVVPVPSFVVSEISGTGTLTANATLFYRVTFYTQVDIGVKFIDSDIKIRLYQPDLTIATVSSEAVITDVDYSALADIFSYLGTQVGDIFTAKELVNNILTSVQELVWNNKVLRKVISERVPVSIFVENQTVIVNTPVNLLVFPITESVEVIEGSLVGPTEVLSNAVTKIYPLPGSVTFFISERASLLYLMSPVSFTVV